MGFISSFLGKLRKDKTNNLPVEYKLVLDFNKDFSDLLKKDKFLARSDYKHLIEQYKDVYVFFNSCQNAKTLQYYCKQNKVDEKTIDYFLHSYKDVENLQIGSTIINEHKVNILGE